MVPSPFGLRSARRTPLLIRDMLRETAHSVPGADLERQGAGAVAPGQAVARALAERHGPTAQQRISPRVLSDGVTFILYEPSTISDCCMAECSPSQSHAETECCFPGEYAGADRLQTPPALCTRSGS